MQLDNVPRQPREVEGADYFCCLEALQNVAKYAEANRTSLPSMRDRVEALGGSLKVTSAPGQGTTIQGRVPVGVASP